MKNKIALASATAFGVIALFIVVLLYPELILQPDPTAHFQPSFDIVGHSISASWLVSLYNKSTYAAFFVLFSILSVYLLWRLISATNGPRLLIDRTTIRSGIDVIKSHPISSVIFLAYAALMYYGTNYFYGEIVGWYSHIYTPDLLENFHLNDRFIAETMTRNDFRFFPLAHQDLHVLSWLTPYVKVWILINALELLTILVVATKLVQGIAATRTPYLFLGAALLLLFAPAAVKPFFQFIYAERMLVVFFALYAYSYLRYQQSREERFFYATLLSALFGIFFKDIAFILFAIPPLITLTLGLSGRYRDYAPRSSLKDIRAVVAHYRLELILIGSLLPYFVLYFFLSALPSLANGTGAYNADKTPFQIARIHDDVTVAIVFVILLIRTPLVAINRIKGSLLDGLNVAAVLYVVALAFLVGYESSSYMSLPVRLVGVLDTLYLWTIAYRFLPSRPAASRLAAPTALVCIACILVYEQSGAANFVNAVANVKEIQAAWYGAYRKARRLVTEKTENGEEVNLIYTKSWFNDGRHLDRLHYDRLVYFDPEARTYVVTAGAGKGSSYQPKSGDLLLLIDHRGLPVLGQELQHYAPVFVYDQRRDDGRIYEYK